MALADMMHDGLRAIAFRALYAAAKDDNEQKKEIAEELKEFSGNMNKYISELDQLGIHAETHAAIEKVKPEIEVYLKSTEKIVGLALAGQKAQAEAYVEEFQKSFESLESRMEVLGELIEKDVEKSRLSGHESAIMFKIVNGLLVLFGLIFGSLISIWLGKDLIKTLSGIIGQLSQSTREVSAASAQSSASATELSEATTEQAASLQQTMASVEEISAMVSQNAESATKTKNAVDANQKVSEDGSRSVNEMLAAIGEIKLTNDEILSQMESSNKEFGEIVKIIAEIGTKTNVINEIVFQTKLLSFNASVEAARAGEHGKGFAVVAEEVGNLAQMSGNAAKEITDMLSDSIKKVNSIVEHTQGRVDRLIEVGKDKITMGQSIGQKCQAALNEITENARSVASMITEITNASKEQAQGVQEINKAISQLDQVTQQNSAVAQQSSTQAEQLNSEASALSNAVSRLVAFVDGAKGNSSPSNENHHDADSSGGSRVLSIVNKVKTARAGSAKSMAMGVEKKAVGSNIVPSSNDPNFEEF